MSSVNFSGVITALATPFLEGKPDKASFLKLLDFQVRRGVRHFVLNSTTGESPTLEEKELESLTGWFREFEKERKSALQLMIGTGTFSTKKTIEKTLWAQNLGADSALIVTPYYNRPSPEGLYRHFKQVAGAVSLPIILYNVPSRTACSLDPPTLQKLLSETDNICGLKEAGGDMAFFRQVRQIRGEGFALLSGDDFTCVESFLAGGDGVISAVSNVLPGKLKEFFERAKNNDSAVLKDFQKYSSFLKALYEETNPLGVKQVLAHLGVIASSETRLPLFTPPLSLKLQKETEALKDSFL